MCDSSTDSPIMLIVAECLGTLSDPEQGWSLASGPPQIVHNLSSPIRLVLVRNKLHATVGPGSLLTRPREGRRERAHSGWGPGEPRPFSLIRPALHSPRPLWVMKKELQLVPASAGWQVGAGEGEKEGRCSQGQWQATQAEGALGSSCWDWVLLITA